MATAAKSRIDVSIHDPARNRNRHGRVGCSALQVSLSNVQPALGPQQPRAGARKGNAATSDSRISTLPHSERIVASSIAREEWALIQKAIGGDSRANEQIFSPHTTRLHRIALSILRNKEDAEDAVQDALCSAYARLRSFEGRSSFSTWLTRIVINSALMIRRRRKGRAETSLEESFDGKTERLGHGIVDAGPNPEEICRITEIHRIVAEGIRQLPPRLREAIQLVELDGLSPADSSQVLGIRQNTFKSRISRARQKIAHRLQQSFQTPPRTLPQAAGEIPSSERVLPRRAERIPLLSSGVQHATIEHR
jgi:RNA polymerase sigma-70 factor (ECF subfamily)